MAALKQTENPAQTPFSNQNKLSYKVVKLLFDFYNEFVLVVGRYDALASLHETVNHHLILITMSMGYIDSKDSNAEPDDRTLLSVNFNPNEILTELVVVMRALFIAEIKNIRGEAIANADYDYWVKLVNNVANPLEAIASLITLGIVPLEFKNLFDPVHQEITSKVTEVMQEIYSIRPHKQMKKVFANNDDSKDDNKNNDDENDNENEIQPVSDYDDNDSNNGQEKSFSPLIAGSSYSKTISSNDFILPVGMTWNQLKLKIGAQKNKNVYVTPADTLQFVTPKTLKFLQQKIGSQNVYMTKHISQ